jgi:[ribosomal protein S5]-alanine N-acetyltransferase
LTRLPQVNEHIIETSRLLLRPMRVDDTDALLHIFADPLVMAAFGSGPFDWQQMARWVERNLEHQARYGYGLYSVMLKAKQLLVGNCGLTRMTIAARGEVELGYDFRSDYWNQGLATEAAAAVRNYAFQVLGLPRLVSLIRHGNFASRRVAEKVGLRFTADITHDGTAYWLYACFRDDMPALPTS